jgi:tetratricopeptide (TPR) repeat protein
MNSRGLSPRQAVLAVLSACLLAAGAFPGCSGSPPAPVPPVKERAASWNRRGIASEARGDREGAVAAFEEALKLNRSIEDRSGTAVSLINLARIHRLRGDLRSARERIDAASALLASEDPLFTETAFEKGMLGLASNDPAAAKEWAEKAVAAARGRDAGRMRNLLARVLFLEGRSEEARGLAVAALETNRKEAARAEEANSLRLLGDIAARARDPAKAEEYFTASLSIDKEIADSRKVAADLKALGAVAASGGYTAKAIAFYERAYDASYNGDDMREAAATLLELARLYERNGETDKARSAETERRRIIAGIEDAARK